MEVTNREYCYAYAIPENRKIIRAALQAYAGLLPEDDLSSCGMVALWRCLKKHDPACNQRFTTSLHRFVHWECKKALRKQKVQRRISYRPFVEQEHKLSEDRASLIRNAIANLTESERKLINQHYFEQMTFDEIGMIHRVSKEAIRRRLLRAVEQLRTVYYSMYPN
jgi:RNA polymerase sigma factor (sigma-70 family)